MIGQTMFINTPAGRKVYKTERDPVTGEVMIIPEDSMYLPNEAGRGQRSSSQSNPYSMYSNIMKMMPTSTATGMTPNAANAAGEPYYGWGAQTGDWGATAGTSAAEVSTMAPEVGAVVPEMTYAAPEMTYATPELGSAAAEAGGSASTMSYLNPLGYIGAGITALHLMSNFADRRTPMSGVDGPGHRSGDIFSGDFATDPWQPLFYQKLGIEDATPGEKWDSALNSALEGESTWDNLLRATPETMQQWVDPAGSFLYDLTEDKLGDGPLSKAISTILFPGTGLVRNIMDWF